MDKLEDNLFSELPDNVKDDLLNKLEDSLFSELPEDMKEEILKWLPVECLCRFRSVSQQWNGLFQSTRFVTTQWAHFRKPWLFMCDLDTKNRCWAYCFFTGTWKPCFTLSSINGLRHDASYRGSAAGLLFVEIQKGFKRNPPPQRGVFSFCRDLIVCNPLAGRSVILPRSSSVRPRLAKGIVAGECDGDRQTYKVVVVRNRQKLHGQVQVARETNPHLQKIEIYDSSEKSWSTETYIPENLRVTGDTMVFSDGHFYCEANSYLRWPDIVRGPGIVSLSLQNAGDPLFVPLPGLPNLYHHLVACGSRILLAGCVFQRKILKEVIIWELLKVKVDSGFKLSWLEIARTPPLMCKDVRRIWRLNRWFEFVGVGDCVCFRGHGSMEVAVYSLTANSWSWLPICPLEPNRVSHRVQISSFEPRPDMKVY